MSPRNGSGERSGGTSPLSESIGRHAGAPTSCELTFIEVCWRRVSRALGTRTGRLAVLALLGVVGAVGAVGLELRTSRLQARFFTALAREATFETAPGPSAAVRFPEAGPYDLRLVLPQINYWRPVPNLPTC